MRHENDFTSKFKCKFYKHLGSPNLATIAKFDKIVKIGSCTQLIAVTFQYLSPGVNIRHVFCVSTREENVVEIYDVLTLLIGLFHKSETAALKSK